MESPNKVLAICGPTAIGKTEIAIETALNLDAEIVSCDSMQLYKYLDVGSAKPTAEELSIVRHHLVDEIDPVIGFSVSDYKKLAEIAIDDILVRGKIPIVAGGTGLYLNSLIYDMDFANTRADDEYRDKLYEIGRNSPDKLHQMLAELDFDASERIHKNNLKKVIRAIEIAKGGISVKDFANCYNANKKYDFHLVGLNRNRDELYERINLRVDMLIEKGLVEEVQSLMDRGLRGDHISMKGIGYKEVISYLNGEIDFEEMVEVVKKNTRHYAKRQITWFKRYDNMKWYDLSNYDCIKKCVPEIVNEFRLTIKSSN